jgi:hypothetical protein
MGIFPSKLEKILGIGANYHAGEYYSAGYGRKSSFCGNQIARRKCRHQRGPNARPKKNRLPAV